MANPFIQGMPMHEGNMFLTDNLNQSNQNHSPSTSKVYIHERKKLELKPRSGRADRARRRSTSSKGDPFGGSPFGAARPREEVLKSRGFDVKVLDSKIEKKAEIPKFSRDQEAQLEAVRSELTKAERSFREANEKELPEEAFRLQVERKRSELNDLIDSFSKFGTSSASPPRGSSSGRYSLPSNFAPLSRSDW